MSHLVVGVDGSPAGDAALLWALRAAAPSGNRVTAVHAWQVVYRDWEAARVQVDPDATARAAHDLADAVVKRVREHAGADSVDVDVLVDEGPPAVVLEHAARAADVLVVGRRHDSAVARAALGSVSSAVLHDTRCPVVVVPSGWHGAVAAARYVVGVDGTAACSAALAWAATHAARSAVPLVPVMVRKAFEDALRAERAPDLRDLEGVESAHLERQARAAAGDPHLDVRPELRVGTAARELVDACGTEDLLVVGSRGRGPLAGWLLGSTSAHLVHCAPVPVAVVREQPVAG